jgi:hypothetical protein
MVVEEMDNWSGESVIACAIAMHERCRFALVISSTLEQISAVDFVGRPIGLVCWKIASGLPKDNCRRIERTNARPWERLVAIQLFDRPPAMSVRTGMRSKSRGREGIDPPITVI